MPVCFYCLLIGSTLGYTMHATLHFAPLAHMHASCTAVAECSQKQWTKRSLGMIRQLLEMSHSVGDASTDLMSALLHILACE